MNEYSYNVAVIQRLVKQVKAQKFNPNHGSDGRFAEGDSGSGGGGGTVPKNITTGAKISADLVTNGQKESFDVSYNETAKITYNGADYFVKAINDEPEFGLSKQDVIGQELAGPAMGEAMHAPVISVALVDHTSPVGTSYIAQNWQEGAVTGFRGTNTILQAPAAEITRNLALEYLTGVSDRHGGNIMVTADGHVREIDFGFSDFVHTKMNVDLASDSFLYDKTRYDNGQFVDDRAMTDILHSSYDIFSAGRQYLSEKQSTVLAKRLDILAEAYGNTWRVNEVDAGVSWETLQEEINRLQRA